VTAEDPARYEEQRAHNLAATRARVTSEDYRDKAARHEEGFTRAHGRLAHTLRAVDELYGPAAAEVLRRLFDDIGENGEEAIDNLHRYAGLLHAELEDRRIREAGELRRSLDRALTERDRLRQAGRVLASELSLALEKAPRRARAHRSAIAGWRAEDPQ
jgi:hypothetical protein